MPTTSFGYMETTIKVAEQFPMSWFVEGIVGTIPK